MSVSARLVLYAVFRRYVPVVVFELPFEHLLSELLHLGICDAISVLHPLPLPCED